MTSPEQDSDDDSKDPVTPESDPGDGSVDPETAAEDPETVSVDSGTVSEDAPEEAARRLHEHLAATGELPVQRHESRVLGEAEAVAADLVACPPAVRREREAVVAELLEEVAETGHPGADAHVEAARRLAERLAR